MKKKETIVLLEFIAEGLILFFTFTLSSIQYMDFWRYGFIYVALYLILERFKESSVLIWQDAHTVLTFYIGFYFITLVMVPLKVLNLSILLANAFISFSTYLFTMLMKRSLHIFLYDNNSYNTLVIGVDEEAERYIKTCQHNRYAMSNVKAVINCNEVKELNGFNQNMVVSFSNVYSLSDLDRAISENNIEIAVLCVSSANKEQVTYIRNLLRNKVQEIKFLPQINTLLTYDCSVQDFDGQLLVSNKLSRLSFLDKLFKRIIDIIVGLFGCLLLLPTTILVKLLYLYEGDRDSIWFVQERVGFNGKKIKIYKFRSMVKDAEKILNDLMLQDESIANEYQRNKKLKNDPRITKVGSFIRKSSIDEFPQFINVLTGSMSLVGPRPYLPGEIKDMGDYFNPIVSCKPGITGMWQVSGRSDVSFNERLKLDEYYADNWSIWLDLTVIIKTIRVVLGKEGAV